MEEFDVLIIGSGLGGLQCGYILSREGYKVCIIEKHHQFGGCLQNFVRDGCVFDTGIHYIGGLEEGQVLNKYFRYFGLMEKLKLRRMNPAAFDIISFGETGKEFPYAFGHKNFIDVLSEYFPEERSNLEKYSLKMKELCDHFPLYNLSDKQMDIAESQFYEENAYTYINSITQNPLLRSVLAGTNPLYAGLAEKTPLYVHALVNNSFIESSWRIVDGSSQITDILVENIKAAGGTMIKNCEAVKLDFEKDKNGIVHAADGRQFSAKYVISDIHPARTLEMINLGHIRKAYRDRICNLENTTSNFSLYVVFNKDTFEYLPHNLYHYRNDNVWSAPNYKPETWPENFLFITPAVSRSEKYTDGAIIMSYMKFDEVKKWEHTRVGRRGSDYLEFKKEKTEILLNLVEAKFPGFRKCIKSCTSSTPLTYRDYTGTIDGSLYGIMKDSTNPLKTLISPKTKIPNLLLTGQNVILHGVLGVTIGAVTTCSEITGLSYIVDKINKA
jgi:all-trans-retinol 13,14-reductase